jgi:hypothetical protein
VWVVSLWVLRMADEVDVCTLEEATEGEEEGCHCWY